MHKNWHLAIPLSAWIDTLMSAGSGLLDSQSRICELASQCVLRVWRFGKDWGSGTWPIVLQLMSSNETVSSKGVAAKSAEGYHR